MCALRIENMENRTSLSYAKKENKKIKAHFSPSAHKALAKY